MGMIEELEKQHNELTEFGSAPYEAWMFEKEWTNQACDYFEKVSRNLLKLLAACKAAQEISKCGADDINGIDYVTLQVDRKLHAALLKAVAELEIP